MGTLSSIRLAVFGGLALSLGLTAGAGVASAAPDLGPIVTTTCNYSQVMAALNAQDPAAAEQFNSAPEAQMMLQRFLASSPAKRQRMADQVAAMPAAAEYIGTVVAVANTCNNF